MADGAVAGRPALHGVRDVVDRLDALTDRPSLSVRDLIAAFGPASFLPLMMVPALLVVSPLSGIPFFSSFSGLTIALIAGQMLLRRDHVWLPGFVMRREVPGKVLHKGAARTRSLADWLDRHAHGRLKALVTPPLMVVPQGVCVLAGAAMPLLEVLPFSSSLLGAAVTLIAVGFLAGDGLFVLAATFFIAAAASVPFLVAGTLAG